MAISDSERLPGKWKLLILDAGEAGREEGGEAVVSIARPESKKVDGKAPVPDTRSEEDRVVVTQGLYGRGIEFKSRDLSGVTADM